MDKKVTQLDVTSFFEELCGEAMLIALVSDSDIFGEASESTSTSATSVATADLTSIDQLLKTLMSQDEVREVALHHVNIKVPL